jgi:hypothetical protein
VADESFQEDVVSTCVFEASDQSSPTPDVWPTSYGDSVTVILIGLLQDLVANIFPSTIGYAKALNHIRNL